MDKCSLSTTIIPLRRQEWPRPSTTVGPVKAKSQYSVPEKPIVIGVQYKSDCQYLVGGGHCGCFNAGGHPQVLTTHRPHKAAIKFCLLPDFQSSYTNSPGPCFSIGRTTFMSNVQRHLWEGKNKGINLCKQCNVFQSMVNHLPSTKSLN